MRALLLLAVALINAPADEPEMMVYDLYAADPRLTVEVLEVADVLDENEGWPCADEPGADTNELAIVIAIIADSKGGIALIPETDPVNDGTFPETFRKALKVKDFTVNVKDAYDVDHPDMTCPREWYHPE